MHHFNSVYIIEHNDVPFAVVRPSEHSTWLPTQFTFESGSKPSHDERMEIIFLMLSHVVYSFVLNKEGFTYDALDLTQDDVTWTRIEGLPSINF